MDAQDLVERARRHLDDVEHAMLAGDIADVEVLRPARDEALRELADAEMQAAAARGRALDAEVRLALLPRDDPRFEWWRRHRKFHSDGLKARLVRLMGSKNYLRAFPW